MSTRPMPTFTEAQIAGGRKRAQAMRESKGFIDPANHKPQDFGLKRAKKRKEVVAYLGKDMICPQCSAEFLRPTEKWAYKIGDKFYCSYRCKRIVERGCV